MVNNNLRGKRREGTRQTTPVCRTSAPPSLFHKGIMRLTFSDGGPLSARDRTLRIALYLAWAALMLFMLSRHAFWRDEVRALNIALGGDNVFDMLRGLQGEGHPAIWYLLLRGAHAIVPVREVLPAVGAIVALVGMALFLWRAPFRPAILILVPFGAFGLLEYAVVARNYGIAMLGLFALAILYPRWRDRGVTIGVVLALLCNTNVPAAWLSACILLFWLIELIGEEGLRWGPKYKLFILNAAVAAFGAFLCFITIYPTVHDAAAIVHPNGITLGTVASALFLPAQTFWELMPPFVPEASWTAAAFGLLLFGSLLGLLNRPAAFFSALAGLFGLLLFFSLVYPGGYRHQSLFLVHLIVMHWLVAKGRGGEWPARWRLAERVGRLVAVGQAFFALILALQVAMSAFLIWAELNGFSYSRSRDFAAVLERENLGDAILTGDPDIYLEPMSYYVGNPIYLMREQRFGNFVRFTRNVRRELTLDDILRDARTLQARTRRPVVIIVEQRLDPTRPFRIRQVHIWYLSGTSEQIRRFQGATRLLARFEPAVTDESFDVYLLNDPGPPPSPQP